MADLQTQFNKFHDTIKIDFDGNKPLREKRDKILAELKAGLKKQYPTNTPTFDWFNQGSYDMATGVEPLEGDDYDIDVGIVFNLTKDDVEPVILKETVYNILNSVYQRKVEIKRPCVRVQYQKAGEKAYHIDLAIYSHGKDFWGKMNDTLYIAKGFSGSAKDKKIWEISEPYKLKELIKSKISDNSDREQLRRVIRYLKRWKDYNFSSKGTERPTGIALTACALKWFVVTKKKDKNGNLIYDDLNALLKLVTEMINNYGFFNKRLTVNLPVAPNNNLFEKMSDNQMATIKTKLIALKDTLVAASSEYYISVACYNLQQIFGNDFPSN